MSSSANLLHTQKFFTFFAASIAVGKMGKESNVVHSAALILLNQGFEIEKSIPQISWTEIKTSGFISFLLRRAGRNACFHFLIQSDYSN